MVPLFNKDEFVSRNLGDLDLARDVATIFVNYASEYIDEICSALTAGDARALVESAHKLKGAAANLALPILSDLARIIELHAKDGDLEKGAEMLPELENRLAQAVKILEEAIITPLGRDIDEHPHC
jgi:HPt (histidine-containing phosphotransfer) domain-containing protein